MIIEVTVNRSNEYAAQDAFDPNSPIIVKYSSDDRTNITFVLEKWKEKDWNHIQRIFNQFGFSDVQVIASDTEEVDKTKKQEIQIGDASYSSGECYVQKSVPIRIWYYLLKPTIGKSDAL